MTKFNFGRFAYGFLRETNDRLDRKAEQQAQMDALRASKLLEFDTWKRKNKIQYQQEEGLLERKALLERETAELEEQAKQSQVQGVFSRYGIGKGTSDITAMRQAQAELQALGYDDEAKALDITTDDLERRGGRLEDPFKGRLGKDVVDSIDQVVERAKEQSGSFSPFFKDIKVSKDKTVIGEEIDRESYTNTAKYAAILAEETPIVNPETGEVETRSQFLSSEVANMSFDIERNLNTLAADTYAVDTDVPIEKKAKAATSVMNTLDSIFDSYPEQERQAKRSKLIRAIPKQKRVRLINFSKYNKYNLPSNVVEKANSNDLPIVATRAEYDTLPTGTLFVDSKGNIVRK